MLDMGAIEQAIDLIKKMNRREKAQLLSVVAADPEVQFHGIAVTPGVCGGSARIAGTRIPVWLLESLREDGATDQQILGAYPQLRSEQLQDAWKFAQENRELIQSEILDNQAD
jgi:uncharacterized protein (DUF433 family)